MTKITLYAEGNTMSALLTLEKNVIRNKVSNVLKDHLRQYYTITKLMNNRYSILNTNI